MGTKKEIETDCGIIGAGLAGCSAALELADAGKKVDLFIKKKLIEDSNSYLTAGGLTAVPLKNGLPVKGDSFEMHIEDTLKAGKYLNDKKIVELCAKRFFPDVIEWLETKGVKWDRANGEYDLHREGGHSANRIFHVKDTTGKAIMDVLTSLVKKHPNIRVHEDHIVIDLITKHKFFNKKGKDSCLGFYVYDNINDCVKTVSCNATFVATGGIGKIFMYTSNQDIATGDGFAMASRVGIPLVNMEFVQFHPTVFYDPSLNLESERRFLLTEALRGAGAVLTLDKNSHEDFVLRYDKLGSKATRDVVSRAEDVEMRKLGLKHVWLDCTKIDPDKLRNDFKNSYDFCLLKGFDLTKESVPVVYAEHYSNGGVLVDKNSESKIENCFFIGEVSYTGLHGATRLASNSAPECILFGRMAAKKFISKKLEKNKMKIPSWKEYNAKEIKDKTTITYYWETVRRTMTSLCGIARNKERLSAAREVLLALKKDINDFYWTYKVNKDFLEVRNITDASLLVVECALKREETRACHYREDFPNENKKFFGLTIFLKAKAEVKK
ncbi:MAG: FAD-binding protein [archaeon]